MRVIGGTLPATFTSRVLRTVKGSSSVRATIPEAVAAILGVEHGSVLIWSIEPGTGRVWVSGSAQGESQGGSGRKKSPKRR
jgi:hypothetical protein